jgi:hypothetical protein
VRLLLLRAAGVKPKSLLCRLQVGGRDSDCCSPAGGEAQHLSLRWLHLLLLLLLLLVWLRVFKRLIDAGCCMLLLATN